MASQIARYAAENRAQILPLLWLFTGPLLIATLTLLALMFLFGHLYIKVM